jgi:signal transduction histidine kinase
VPPDSDDAAVPEAQERAVLRAIENEQQLLAQALHDTVCQSLSGMTILASIIAKKLQATAPEAAAEVTQLGKLIFEAGEEMQGLVRWLRPPVVGSAGLTFALTELARETSKRVRCQFKPPPGVLLLDPYAAAQLYSIAHGAVHRALERTGVSRIAIGLKVARRLVTLTIQDNARATETAETASSEGRFGWEVLQRRGRVIGATLTSEAVGAKGTRITCTFPLPKPAD